MSCLQRQGTEVVAREQKEWCIKQKTKNLRKFAHMVLTALACCLLDQLWRKAPLNRTENLCDMFWCLMSPVHCPQLRMYLAQHHAYAIGWIQRCDLKIVKRAARGAAPWKMTLQEPGEGAVLVGVVSSPAGVSATVATEGKCSVTFQWCRSQMGMVGAAKTLLPSELLQKTVEKF